MRTASRYSSSHEPSSQLAAVEGYATAHSLARSPLAIQTAEARRRTSPDKTSKRKARRGRGEGNVYQRSDGLWRGTASLGWDENGRRRRKSVYAKTKAELLTKLNGITPGAIGASAYDVERSSVKDFLERWLATRVRIRAKTRAQYESIIRVHIIPALGKMNVGAIKPATIEQFIGRLKHRKVGDRTAELSVIILGAALNKAVRRRLLPFSPVADVERPRAARRLIQVWTSDHVHAFLAAAASDRYHALYVLALTTGMREGELLGLRRSDVDLERGFLSVVKQRVVDPLKTGPSRRRINLSKVAVTALRAHFAAIDGEKHRSGLAFPSHAGTIVNPSNLVARSFLTTIESANKQLEKDGKTLRVPRIRFQDLRHTCATLLLERGVHPKVVAELLGHASIRMTLDTYSHLIPTMHQVAADQFDEVLASNNGVSKRANSRGKRAHSDDKQSASRTR